MLWLPMESALVVHENVPVAEATEVQSVVEPSITETVVVADEGANPAWVAADLLAQAEHDVLASAILLTPSERLAHAVQAEILQEINSDTHISTALGNVPFLANTGAIM